MIHQLVLIPLMMACVSSFVWAKAPVLSEERVFKLHLSSEPITLDPAQQRGSGAMYLMNTLQRPLFRTDKNKAFIPSVLKECRWIHNKNLLCQLVDNLRWSNGKTLSAEDVHRTFRYFMDPKTNAARKDLIENIKDVIVKNALEVEFRLIKEEPRFQERLTNPLLSPIFSTTFPKTMDGQKIVTAGPYQIEHWKPKQQIRLTPNLHFPGHAQRPVVEFYFIPEDTTALMLYKKGKLDFLRRVPTAYLKSYQSDPELHQVPLLRFDYVGFGPSLAKETKLREMLARSLNFQDWQLILQARGRPGCFGIGLDLIKSDPCYTFQKDQLSSWQDQLQKAKLPPLELVFSTLGGEDHKRSMEWLQSEWKKNLKITVSVKGIDHSLFQKQINETPPSLYRFGSSLEHPSCANALKNFLMSPEASLPYKNQDFLKITDRLFQLKPEISEDSLCTQALEALVKSSWIIPLGRIHVSLLAKKQWRGWHLSALNYLDLSQLHWE